MEVLSQCQALLPWTLAIGSQWHTLTLQKIHRSRLFLFQFVQNIQPLRRHMILWNMEDLLQLLHSSH